MLFKPSTDGPPQSFTPATARSKPPKTVAKAPQRGMPRSGGFAEIDLDARAHRRADRDLLDELALGARRLGLEDRVDERREILLEVGFGEARLADPGVDDP